MAELPSGTVTFLLTDVEGSTPLWDQAADTMRAAMVRHDALFEHTVAAHDGIHIRPRGEGDSRFAVFGQVTDAVAAAVAVQLAFASEPWPTPRPIEIRIGVHTAEAQVRGGDYYGSEVNRCARLRGIGYGGQILLSEVTATLARGTLPSGVSLVDLGEYRLRGLSRPERVFQVRVPGLRTDFPPLNVAAGSEGVGVAPVPVHAGPSAPPALLAFPCSHPFPAPANLVNRTDEMAELMRVLDRARSSGRVILLGAPAGTGKSTLVGELVRRAEADGLLCLAGACFESGVAGVLSPFQDALADYLVSQPPEPLRQELGRSAEDLAFVIPELRYHLDIPDRPSAELGDRLRLFGAALHTYLRRLAQAGPILLCIEDLHLADEATLGLLRFLTHRVRGAPLLLVGTYRTDEVLPGAPLAVFLADLRRDADARRLPIHQMTLQPFDRPTTTQLVHSLLGDPAGHQLSASLYAISEGNPLFVEQLLLELREGGRLERRGGEWHRRAEAPQQIPAVIGELIGRRLGRVSEHCQTMLELIAVLGTSVQHHLLAESMATFTGIEVLPDLEEAFGAQLIKETPSGYAFTHALLRETVYWRLNDVRRWRLHAVAGATIERLAGDRAADVAAELARHFFAAERLIEVREKAIRYNLEAGRRAAALSSHREALEHFSRVCQLLERDGEPADYNTWLEALDGRCNAEWALWLWRPLIADSERLLQVVTDPVRRARALNAIGYAQQQTGDIADATAAFQAALADLDAAGDRPDAVVPRFRLQVERSYLWFLQGRFFDMLRQGEELVAQATALGQPLLIFWAHNSVSLAQMGLGDLDDALAHGEQACAAAEQTGDPMRLAVAVANFGIVHCFAGALATARPHLERAIELYHEAAADRRAANTLQWLGRVWLALGDPEQARRLADQANAYATEAHDRWAADCHDVLGIVHALRAEWEAAEADFEQALAIRSTVGHAASRVGSLLGLGVTFERRGDWVRAREQYEAAVAVAVEMDPSPFEAAARTYLGSLLHRLGEATGADHLERAHALIATMPRSVEQGPMLVALADVNWRGADRATRQRFAEQALGPEPAADVAAQARIALAHLHAKDGQLGAARVHADAARALAERLGSPRLTGLALAAAGRIAGCAGDPVGAAAAYDAAIGMLEAARTPYDLALVLREYGTAVAEQEPERARAMLTRALGLLQQVGARPAADRCRALLDALDE
jgi:class 3 adenylate cyclase/tetratricopeptide (TPR) repeat protein